jgi:DNA-binding transcriptional regulator YdaS (Cro superfamily)
MNGIERAIEYAGGTGQALADLLDVTPGAITKWRKEGGLPAARAIEIEQHSGGKIKAFELLRPAENAA